MSIQHVKIIMSKFGVTSSEVHKRKQMYLPCAEITYCGDRKGKKRAPIDDLVPSKKYHDGLIEGMSFFAVMVAGEYRVFNEDIKLSGKLSIADIGTPIQVGEDYFICRKGDDINAVNDKGEVFISRPLTDEEKERLGSTM